MHTIGHPTIAMRIARQRIDDRIRDAEARRIARAVRRKARTARDLRTANETAAGPYDCIDTATALAARGLPRPVTSHPEGETP